MSPEDKVRTFWKANKFWKNIFYGFDVYLVNQLICQNHKKDLIEILSASQKVRTLLTGEDIETGRSMGSDYGAALHWMSKNQNKRP